MSPISAWVRHATDKLSIILEKEYCLSHFSNVGISFAGNPFWTRNFGRLHQIFFLLKFYRS